MKTKAKRNVFQVFTTILNMLKWVKDLEREWEYYKSKQLNDKDITPPNEPLISNKVR